jgi:hypothetical protein
MMTIIKRLSICLVGLAVAIGVSFLLAPVVLTQSINCGGSFTPNLNCLISGLWNFTAVDSGSGLPIPFQVNGLNASGVVSSVVDLTNTQVLALGTTPITVVAAPGTGYYVDVIGVSLNFKYTGAYTNPLNVRLYYTSLVSGIAASSVITGSGFFDATANKTVRVAGTADNTTLPVTNVAVVLTTTTGSNMTGGNAANKVRVVVNYRIVATGF